GKPIAQAKTEIDRAIAVFRDGAEEATRIGGEVLPADVVPSGTGRIAITRRFPLSPIAAITPFNFPVLLAAHKIAPPLASGAAARCAIGGFTYAGQSCISTQRILVQERVSQTFLDLLLDKVKHLKVGDVLDEHTDVGPMISLEAAERVERWIAEAVAAGARVELGGKRNG